MGEHGSRQSKTLDELVLDDVVQRLGGDVLEDQSQEQVVRVRIRSGRCQRLTRGAAFDERAEHTERRPPPVAIIERRLLESGVVGVPGTPLRWLSRARMVALAPTESEPRYVASGSSRLISGSPRSCRVSTKAAMTIFERLPIRKASFGPSASPLASRRPMRTVSVPAVDRRTTCTAPRRLPTAAVTSCSIDDSVRCARYRRRTGRAGVPIERGPRTISSTRHRRHPRRTGTSRLEPPHRTQLGVGRPSGTRARTRRSTARCHGLMRCPRRRCGAAARWPSALVPHADRSMLTREPRPSDCRADAVAS